jgi:hypothetical protein
MRFPVQYKGAAFFEIVPKAIGTKNRKCHIDENPLPPTGRLFPFGSKGIDQTHPIDQV